MKKQMPAAALLLIGLLFASWTAEGPATPTGNPLRRYTYSFPAWANSIPWNRVVNVREIPGLVNENDQVDSALLMTTQLQLLQKGGGILYFPPGSYLFKTDVAIMQNVLFRGAAPPQITKFFFPRLTLTKDLGRFQDTPPDSLTATPAHIYSTGQHGAFTGLVDIDINRALIMLGYDRTTKDSAIVYTPAETPADNVLITGVRNNNAAALDPRIPTAIQKANDQDWQIWPDASIGNCNIHYSGAALVYDCRFNDDITDNIRQNDFLLDDKMALDGSLAVFRFADHPIITISRPATAIHAANAEITANHFFLPPGFDAITAKNGTVTEKDNQLTRLAAGNNWVKDGHTAVSNQYDVLYDGRSPSKACLYTDHYGDSLPYRLIQPPNYDPTKKYPLVLYLHDFWAKGDDNKTQLRQFLWQMVQPETAAQYPCFIVAPQLPLDEPRWKCGGLGSETWPLQCSVHLLRQLSRQYNIDTTRIYVIGNSMGGAGAINVATHYPQMFAAVLSMGVFYRLTDNASLQLRHTPLWIIYGSQEERIRPEFRQEIKTYLRLANVPLKFTDIPGYGHRCWQNIVKEQPDLLPWLFAQQLKQ
ncbi:MAG TPA: alpha/beta hydrolase-fold protein [Puia sp.]|uniref:carboxylesterase family protein n=1 Tax=Puia sp. TaxID=2045100 RepID=UPI002CC86E76|nr:alpha/beta hydrolase-fold protein [Puia sp.]HVU94509.1 alpha/beta hydrolase-fold protein [Puia sp.]